MATDLQSLSKKELIELAKKKDIKMPYLYRKAELIKLIQKKDHPTLAITKPRGLAARSQDKRLRAGRGRVRAASAKPYYEPTYHQETVHNPIATAVEMSPAASHGYQPQQELPYSYNETKIVLMVRDPYWGFTYWDLSDSTTQKVNTLMKEHYGNIRPILRVYDVTDMEFNGKNAHRSFDIDIFIEARNWYINLSEANRAFLVDLGLLDGQGNFYLIARSNVVKTPRDGPSEIIDEEWMAIDFEEMYALSGGFGVGLSSQELKQKKKKLYEQLLAAPGSGLFSGVFSGSPGARPEKKGRDFFLQVATELIVYGRTVPDAKVTVSGESVKLRPDGTFSLRYFLPDGDKHLPIQAVSSDDEDSRKVAIRVKKETAAE